MKLQSIELISINSNLAHRVIANPRAMFGMVDRAVVAPVAAESEERFRRIIDEVGGKEAV